jgi:hypothetical protein
VSSNGAVQPPNAKPPLESSSGPPGACITPSRLSIVVTINFLITYLLDLVEMPSPRWSPPQGV